MITYYLLKEEQGYSIVDSVSYKINSKGNLEEIPEDERVFIMCRPLVRWDRDKMIEIAEKLKPGEYEVVGTF